MPIPRPLTLIVLALASAAVAGAGVLALSTESTNVNIFGSFLKGASGPSNPDAAKPARDPSTPRYSRLAFDITPLTDARVNELAKKLTPEEAKVILRKGTEAPFCGNLLDNKKEGTYTCRLCELPLFKSDHKFNSGTGWPSFFQPVSMDHIDEISDTSHGMVRTEILCTRCHAHLGHVFDDGPRPTGLRYCVNSASLDFVENGQPMPPGAQPVKTETAYFAGGCFWGVEDRFQQLPGVVSAVSGYMGGTVPNPTYKQVCTDTTGHAEVVKILYDPAKITYRTLLEKFFKFHSPTQLNRQGPDIGTQYRSAIFAADQTQLDAAKSFIAEQAKADRFKGKTIVTKLELAAKPGEPGQFWEAEEYHQDYHLKNGGHCALPEE